MPLPSSSAAFLLRFRLSSDACVLLVILLGSRETGRVGRGNSTVGGVAAAACQTDLEALAVAVAVAVASARVAFLPLLFPFPFGTIELATPKPSQADCGRCCLLSCSEYHMPTGCPQCRSPVLACVCQCVCVCLCAGTAAAACSNCIDLRGEKHRPCR